MTEDNNINKLFRDVFENLEVTPPVSLKMGIDKELGPKRKFRFIFWWLPVLVLLLGGVAFAVVRYGTDESGIKQAPVAPLNATSVGQGDSSSDDSSGISFSSRISETGLNDQKQSVDKKEPVQTVEKAGSELKEKEVVQGATKQQRFGLKKGSTTQPVEKGPGSKGQAGLSKYKQKQLNGKHKISSKLKKGQKDVSRSSEPSKTGSEKTNSVLEDSEQKQDPGQANVSASPEKTDPAGLKSKEKSAQTKEPADSVQKTDSLGVAKTDSLVKPTADAAKAKPSKNDSKARNWMVELYGGPRFGAKTSKTEFVLKEAASYQIGLGFSRNLELGPLKYVTLDGEYGSGKESYKQNITTNSIYFVGIDSIPYFDTIGDTIPAGYTYYNNYDTTTSIIENTRNATITRFAFALKAQFNFNLGGGFGLAVVPGYYYSMSRFRFSDSGSVYSSSSSQILLGLGVYYDWNRFRFRIGLDTRYELMRKNENLFIDRRKSLLFLPQFGIAVKF